MEAIKPFSVITPDMIDAWKARYGDVLSEVNIEGCRYIVRIPSRRTIELILKHENDRDIIAASNTVISNCILGGDMDEMNQDGNIYKALLEVCGKLVKEKKTEIKKI